MEKQVISTKIKIQKKYIKCGVTQVLRFFTVNYTTSCSFSL